MLDLLGDSRDFIGSYGCLHELMESIHHQILGGTGLRKSTALQYGILEFVATEGANTIYRIKTDLALPISSVWNIITKLETNGLIRIAKEDTWRTGLQRRYYAVTSIGLAPVLALIVLTLDEEWEEGDVLTIDGYPRIQKRFEGDIKGMLSSIARKNAYLPVYTLLFQNWHTYEEALRDRIQTRLSDLGNFFDAESLLPLFLDITQLARSYCYMVRRGEFPDFPPLPSPLVHDSSSDLLQRPDVLRDFRRKASRKIAWAYFRALFASGSDLLESFRVFYACYAHEDALWQPFFSTYGKMVEEELEDLVVQHEVDLKALKALAKIVSGIPSEKPFPHTLRRVSQLVEGEGIRNRSTDSTSS